MNEAILKRTQLWTVVAAAGLSLLLAFVVSSSFAGGLFLTALWAVASFWLLERLLRAMIVPPGTRRRGFVIVAWLALKLALYGLAIWAVLASPFPAASHLIGFSLLLVVLVVVGVATRPRASDQPAPRGDDD